MHLKGGYGFLKISCRHLKADKITVFLIFVLLLGIGIFSYPFLSNLWNSYHATSAISNYNDDVSRLSEEESAEIIGDAENYNRRLYEKGTKYYLDDDEKEEYMNLLNISEDGIMGYIEIPKISVYLPIYHTSEESVLQKGVGHVEWSSLPAGGENSHCILSGHRGLPSAKLFSDLNLVEIGDVFYITVAGEKLTYQVDRIVTVLPDEAEYLDFVPGGDYVTLITCTPYGINSHRLLVRGRRIKTEEEKILTVTSDIIWIDKNRITLILFAVFLASGLAFSGITDRLID